MRRSHLLVTIMEISFETMKEQCFCLEVSRRECAQLVEPSGQPLEARRLHLCPLLWGDFFKTWWSLSFFWSWPMWSEHCGCWWYLPGGSLAGVWLQLPEAEHLELCQGPGVSSRYMFVIQVPSRYIFVIQEPSRYIFVIQVPSRYIFLIQVSSRYIFMFNNKLRTDTSTRWL